MEETARVQQRLGRLVDRMEELTTDLESVGRDDLAEVVAKARESVLEGIEEERKALKADRRTSRTSQLID